MTNSNLEPWEKALLPMPELKPSEPLSNTSNPFSYDNSCEPGQGLYAELKRDNDDWDLELKKQREVRTKTLLWIQTFVSTHPEGIDDTSYALAQPSSHPDEPHEKASPHKLVVVPAPRNKPTRLLPLAQTTSLARNREGFEAEFPARSPLRPGIITAPIMRLRKMAARSRASPMTKSATFQNDLVPTQMKPSPIAAQALINASTAKVIEAQKSSTNKTYAAALPKDATATQRDPASTQKTPAQLSNAVDPDNSKYIPCSTRATSSKNANQNSIVPFLQPETQNPAFSISRNPQNRPNEPWMARPKSIADSANDTIELRAQQALFKQGIIHTSQCDWKECRCDQRYEEHKSEYSQHKGNCED